MKPRISPRGSNYRNQKHRVRVPITVVLRFVEHDALNQETIQAIGALRDFDWFLRTDSE